MAQLIVRGLAPEIVAALKERAAARGVSAETEHREILMVALQPKRSDFAERARSLRLRLRSTADSADVIRADRDLRQDQ